MENIFLSDAELPATVADIKHLQNKIEELPEPVIISGNGLSYGGSLLVNANLEQNNASFTTGIIKQNSFKGFNSIEKSSGYVYFNTPFYRTTDKLYKVEFFAKGVGFLYVATQDFNSLDVVMTKTLNNWQGAFPIYSLPLTSNFVKYKSYFGGDNNTYTSFAPNSVKSKIGLAADGANSILEFCQLIVKEIDLGEAVPHNLPFIPNGQTVVDNTTGKVGRYNGTSIDWYM